MLPDGGTPFCFSLGREQTAMTYDPASIAPYSQDAEEAALGAVLINPESYFAIASFLRPEDFFILRHQYIWEAMSRLAERNETIDLLTVREELRAQSRLNDIGGAGYLTQLTLNVPTSVHAEVYGRLVERAAVRRRLLTAADEIRGLAMDETLSLDKVVGDAEGKLFQVTERNLRRDMVPMREAISEYFDRLEHLMAHPDEPLGLPTGFRDLDTILGGLQRSDLLIFAGRPGMGKCVTGDTLIPTQHGLIPIEQLKPQGAGEGFTPLEIGVQTPYGMRMTSHFYDSGIKPTLRVTTLLGLELTGTYNHPVMVLDCDGERKWKTLDRLVVGDFVAVQRHSPVWGDNTELPSFTYPYNANLRSMIVPKLPTRMTPDLAYVLGLLAGDGNLTQKNYVAISSADPEIVSVFYAWAAELGVHPRQNSAYDHEIGSVVVNTWLKHLGLSGYAHEKEVPYTVLRSDKECICAFLQGLFDTDGHAELQNGYLQLATTSRRLAVQVQILLLQFGVVSRLTFRPNDYRGAWSLRITGTAARNFYERVGFRLTRKQDRRNLVPIHSNTNKDVVPYLPKRISPIASDATSNYYRYFLGQRKASYEVLDRIAAYAPEVKPLLDPPFYWDEVTSVVDAGLQHCYDLTIPDGSSFVSNGIVSHNTSFLLSVALNAAKLGGRILIFTMEMGSDQIVQRLVSMETGINTQKLRLGQLSQQEWARFVQASGKLGSLPIFIDDTPSMTPLQIRTKSRRIAHEHGLDLVIIDYLQLMTAGTGYENNRVQEISYISRNLKEMARELNVPVFSAAQLSRAVESRQDKRPQLSDLRESGSIEQDSDIVIFLYRDAVYNEATEFPNMAEVIISKHRNGPTGTINLHFEKSLTKFSDARTQTIDLSSL